MEGGLCPTSGARAVSVADLAGSVVAVASCCCRCSTHKTKNSHTLGFLLDMLDSFFSIITIFGFQLPGLLVGGGMCLWENSIDKLGQKWFEPYPDYT